MEKKNKTGVSYTGINHLAMATADMDMTIAFWRDLLGMRLVTGLGHPGSRHYFFEISQHDMIAFFEWPDVKKIPEKDHGAPAKTPLVHTSPVPTFPGIRIMICIAVANKIHKSEIGAVTIAYVPP